MTYFLVEVNKLQDTIDRVREVLQEWEQDISNTTEQKYYERIVKALDGEQ